MPGEDIHSWSKTAANNDDADTAINWSEGQARASVNDSARAMMAAHAKHRNLLNGSILTTGTGNAQLFDSGVGYTEIPNGLRVLLQIGASNTGAATLNMDGIGASPIKNFGGGSLVGGELVSGGFVEMLYKSGDWRLLYQTVESVLLNTTTINDVSAVNYTGLITGEFTKYVFVLTEITPKQSGTVHLYCRVSTDGGLTWKNGASDYSVVMEDFNSTGSGTGTYTSMGSAATSAVVLATGLSTATNNQVSGEIELYKPHVARYCVLKSSMVGINSAVGQHLYRSSGCGVLGPVNGLQLIMSTGNIKSGDVLLYGINA